MAMQESVDEEKTITIRFFSTSGESFLWNATPSQTNDLLDKLKQHWMSTSVTSENSGIHFSHVISYRIVDADPDEKETYPDIFYFLSGFFAALGLIGLIYLLYILKQGNQ
jgi:hypothetical protein